MIWIKELSLSAILKKFLIAFLLIASLYYAKDFLIPFLIGGFLAALFLPLCKWLERRKVPGGIAALFCLLILLTVTGIIGLLIGWQISGLLADIVLIKDKVISTAEEFRTFIYERLQIPAEKKLMLFTNKELISSGIIQSFAGSFRYILTACILILTYVFLLLYYRKHIKNFIKKLFSSQQYREVELIIFRAVHISQQYLLGLAKMIFCLWVMYGIGFSIIGIQNAIFFAIICGLLEIIPFIGNITGTTITILVAAIHGASFSTLLAIAGTYGVVQFIQGWILEPIIVGPQVKINPLFTVIALVGGELLWGIPGIILAIPLTAVLKIVCDHVPALQPYGFLIGEIKTKNKLIKKIKGG